MLKVLVTLDRSNKGTVTRAVQDMNIFPAFVSLLKLSRGTVTNDLHPLNIDTAVNATDGIVNNGHDTNAAHPLNILVNEVHTGKLYAGTVIKAVQFTNMLSAAVAADVFITGPAVRALQPLKTPVKFVTVEVLEIVTFVSE